MCKDILEDKTLNVEEMMNNLNSLPVPAPTPLTVTPEPGTGVTANGGPHRLPEKVRNLANDSDRLNVPFPFLALYFTSNS